MKRPTMAARFRMRRSHGVHPQTALLSALEFVFQSRYSQ